MKGSGGRTVGQNASDSDLLNLAIDLPLPASKNSCRSWEQVH